MDTEQSIEQLQTENSRLREALQYIVDHDWVAGATPDRSRSWINQFVDVARTALLAEKEPAT